MMWHESNGSFICLQRRKICKHQGLNTMLDNGLYSLTYTSSDGDQTNSADGLAVFRNGHILGSDRLGSVFTGSYNYDSEIAASRVNVRLKVPAGGVLISGFRAGEQDALLEIKGCFARAAPSTSASLDIAGTVVAVRLTYLGALPN